MRAILAGLTVGLAFASAMPFPTAAAGRMGQRPELLRSVAPHHLFLNRRGRDHRDFDQFAYPLGYFGDDLSYGGGAPALPPDVAIAPPSAAPAVPATTEADERASVEVTDGVTIVRGPGSHHIAR